MIISTIYCKVKVLGIVLVSQGFPSVERAIINEKKVNNEKKVEYSLLVEGSVCKLLFCYLTFVYSNFLIEKLLKTCELLYNGHFLI